MGERLPFTDSKIAATHLSVHQPLGNIIRLPTLNGWANGRIPMGTDHVSILSLLEGFIKRAVLSFATHCLLILQDGLVMNRIPFFWSKPSKDDHTVIATGVPSPHLSRVWSAVDSANKIQKSRLTFDRTSLPLEWCRLRSTLDFYSKDLESPSLIDRQSRAYPCVLEHCSPSRHSRGLGSDPLRILSRRWHRRPWRIHSLFRTLSTKKSDENKKPEPFHRLRLVRSFLPTFKSWFFLQREEGRSHFMFKVFKLSMHTHLGVSNQKSVILQNQCNRESGKNPSPQFWGALW